MSDEPKYLTWTACIAAGAVGLAALGYFLGPPHPKSEKPVQGGRSQGGPPGQGPSGSLSQEDLFRLLLQQQLQQQQAQQAPQPKPQHMTQQLQKQSQQQLQQLMGLQQQKALAGSPKPKPTPAPAPATSSGTIPLAAPEIKNAKEERVKHYIQTYRLAMVESKFDEAEAILEQMAADLGRGFEWQVACMEGMRFYESLENWEKCVALAKKILSHLLSAPLQLETSESVFPIIHRLGKAATKAGCPREGLEESQTFLSRLSDLIDACEGEPEKYEAAIDIYLYCANLLVLQKYRQLALWTDLRNTAAAIHEKIRPVRPTSLDRVVESQASALHQEGKTLEAIGCIQSFYDFIKEIDDEGKHKVIPWCLSRMAKFHFYLDQYAESLALLEQLVDYHKERESRMSPQDLLDLAAVYVELGDEEKAEATLDQIRALPGSNICTRSRYLITTDYTLTDKYDINVKVCRAPPARKEGDEEDDEDNYIRKLDNFFLEVTFENPDKDGESIVVEQPIDHYDIDIKTSKLTVPPPKQWYTIKMVLYKDGSKEEIIGKHYQLVYPGVSSY